MFKNILKKIVPHPSITTKNVLKTQMHMLIPKWDKTYKIMFLAKLSDGQVRVSMTS